ncbi:hypothetical protein [Nonomuraea jabiensis]
MIFDAASAKASKWLLHLSGDSPIVTDLCGSATHRGLERALRTPAIG